MDDMTISLIAMVAVLTTICIAIFVMLTSIRRTRDLINMITGYGYSVTIHPERRGKAEITLYSPDREPPRVILAATLDGALSMALDYINARATGSVRNDGGSNTNEQ